MKLSLKYMYVLLFLICLHQSSHAQENSVLDKNDHFQSIELKSGIGLPFFKLYNLPLNITYQKNISTKFAVIGLQELIFEKTANNEFDMRESIGFSAIGTGLYFKNKRFQNGVFLMGGVRYYKSILQLKQADFNNTKLITRSNIPEMGLLYNIKIGKGRLYFASQIYFSMTPIKNIIESDNHTLMVGLGYRL